MLFCLALMLSLGCVSVTPRYTRTPDQMAEINSAVVALVYQDAVEWETYCGGVFIGRETVLTAEHCFEGATTNLFHVSVYRDGMGHYFESERYAFYIDHVDEDADLVLLRKYNDDHALPQHHWFSVGQTAPTQGENVILMGHPHSLGWTLTAGVVSSDQRLGWDDLPYELLNAPRPLFIQHDASAYQGSSGGALLNHDNELVGLMVAAHPVATHLAMSVHTDIINEFLEGQEL